MTQPGETDDYSASNHINAIIEHAGSEKIMDAILVNDHLPKNLAEKYEAANSFPVKLDTENIKKAGVKIVSKKLIEESKEGLVRHSSNRVARAIYHWYRKQQQAERMAFFGVTKSNEKEQALIK